MKKLYDEIFKFDTKGKIRTWRMEQDGARYRTIAGIKKGKLVESDWTVAQPTNVGRSNERDGIAQATFEIEAAYENKLTREYHKDIASAGDGAHFFKPMLAQKYEDFEPGYVQPKLDGIRCIAKFDGLFTREGKPIPGADHIASMLAMLFRDMPDLILDGELYNHDLKDDFNTIVGLVRRAAPDEDQAQRARDLIQYHVYDLPSHPGVFSDRSRVLAGLLDNSVFKPCIKVVPTFTADSKAGADDLHGWCLTQGYEGSMFRLDKPYEQKRSKTLLKRKEFIDEEFEVVRIEEGQGNWSGVAKRAVCRLKDGREFGAGIKGDKKRAAALLHEVHKVATIKFFAYTPDGIPRFPVAIKFHGNERTL